MPSDPIWRGVLRKGKVFLLNTIQYAMYLNCFKDETPVEVIVRKQRKPNSRRQQCYYRAVMLPHVAKMLGVSTEMAHGHLQLKFFTMTDENGLEYIQSTALNKWTTVSWEEKMKDVREWAFDFHEYLIPKPNEVDF